MMSKLLRNLGRGMNCSYQYLGTYQSWGLVGWGLLNALGETRGVLAPFSSSVYLFPPSLRVKFNATKAGRPTYGKSKIIKIHLLFDVEVNASDGIVDVFISLRS